MQAPHEIRRFSLRSYLSILIGAIVLPLAIVIGYSIYKDTRQAISEARATVQTLATVIAANTSRTLSSNRERLELLAARPLIRAFDENKCDPILGEYLDLFPHFANLTTIDLRGRAICSAVPQPGGKPVNVFNTEWFQRAQTEKRFLAGNPFRGPITGKWVSVLISPVYAEGNQIKGYLGLPLDLHEFDPSVSTITIPANSRYGIVGGDGTLIWRNIDQENLVGTNRSDLSAIKQILTIKHGVFDDVGVDRVHRYFAAEPIAETGWYAYAAVPYESINQQVSASLLRGGLVGMWYLLLVTALAYFLARRIETPMKALAQVARSLKRGDISIRARAHGPREVAEVAAEFNAMADAWSLSTGQLRASEERFRTVADYAGDWEYWEGPHNEVFYMSPSCEGITGYPRERFIEDPGLLDRIVHPDDAEAIKGHRHEVDQCLQPAQLDFRIVRADGGVRWIAHQCAAVRDSKGRYNGRRINNRDITERKETESRLARLSSLYAALSETNEAIARIRERSTLMREVCRITVTYGHFQAAWVGMASADGELATVAKEGDAGGYFDRPAMSSDEAGPHGLAFREGRHVVFNDLPHDPCALPWRDAALHVGFRAAGAFPFLTSEGKVVGVLALYASSAHFFDDELIELVRRLTEDVSLALDNIELDEKRRRAEEQLKGYSKRLKLATEAAAIGIWEIDLQRHETVWDERMFEMFGLPATQQITAEIWRRTVHPDDLPEANVALRRAMKGERVGGFVFRIIRHGDGALRYIQGFATASRDAAGTVAKVVGVDVDITERKRMEQALQEMATIDALTGLPNRRQFMSRFEDLLAQVQRQAIAPAAVLMLDLDYFKRVNDQYGHAAGDAVLKQFAVNVSSGLRKIDLVGRVGGEEFAIALPGADPAAARAFAERLCQTVAQFPAWYNGQVIPITVSIGIAEIHSADTSVDAVLIRADEALYRAKEGGRNRVVLHAEPG